MSKDIDYIDIDDKSDRDLLVATVTRLNTITQTQCDISDHLKTLNGTVARNVKEIERNRDAIKTHNHWKHTLAIVGPLCGIIGVLINCLFK